MHVVFRGGNTTIWTLHRKNRGPRRYNGLPITFDARTMTLSRWVLDNGAKWLTGALRVLGVDIRDVRATLVGRFLSNGLFPHLVSCKISVVNIRGVVLFVFHRLDVSFVVNGDVGVFGSVTRTMVVCLPSRFSLYFGLVTIYGNGVTRVVEGARRVGSL